MGSNKTCKDPIECQFCKLIFKPWRKNQKFCSLDCLALNKWDLKKKDIESGKATYPKILKKYLYEKIGNFCHAIDCGWDKSKPIKVELEHIDGNSTNNKLDNLTLLCPNCHSLTNTYKGKNRGKGRQKRRKRYQEGKSW